MYFGPPSEPSREVNVLNGVQLEVNLSYVSTYTSSPVVPAVSPVFSPNGAFGAVLLHSGHVIITSAATGAALSELNCDSTTMNLDFSPQGNFLVSWARPVTGDTENLKVWRVSTGECVCSFSQKSYRKDIIQWTADESICCRLVTNVVHILNGHNPGNGIIGKVHHKGLNAFKVCPVSSKRYICVFAPAAGGKSGQTALYRYSTGEPTAEEGSDVGSAVSVTSRGVLSATEGSILWAPTGVAVLVHTQSDVDRSNTSYYGSSGLVIMSSAGCMDGSVDRDLVEPLSAAVAQV